uniref:Uncharacterized protein n=1 Tax=Tetradesmus obliquus TaxID=3088 RepID=A0A383WBX4_TETOB|eukprot:jgi/Sobl393_1/10697/SZX74733.1
MALNDLDALTWRVLALQLPDPAAFSSCCKRANHIVRDEKFRVEWFAAHHRSRAPDRPWQYAALTWQLHRHASPEQIAAFILRFHAWQKQQQNMAAGYAGKATAAATASPAASSAAARQAAATESTVLQPLMRIEGYFSLPLDCKLLPSTVRRAQQLLAKGRALDALYHLCPSSTSVLCAYAAKSHNLRLMQQLLKHRVRDCMVFPSHWFKGVAGSMYLRTDFACSYAALAAGNPQMLRQVLLCAGDLGESWRSRLLLCYAARHSNAECLQEVLLARQAHVTFSRRAVAAAPQHLPMAAARTDSWAAGVVSQLLQALKPKQRKAANVRPAYKAACSSGCMPVLAVLAGVAAAAPHQQLPVLLEAAAEATCRRYGDAGYHPGTSQQQQWDAAEDACRLQMAELLWQQLVVQHGREAALRQYLRAPVPTKHRGTQHPAAAAAAAAAAAGGRASALRAVEVNSRLLFCHRDARGSYLLGDFSWRAMSAARLQRLAGFVHGFFADMPQALQHPLLLRSLLGGFYGRAVTPGGLAEELGLPWPLLQRLLAQRVDSIARMDSSSTSEVYNSRRNELLEAVQHTLMLAQDQEATAQQLRSAAACALVSTKHMVRTLPESGQAAGQEEGNATAMHQQQQQQPQQQQALDPMQQLVNQLNAGLLLQNPNAQANAALQQVQQLVQQLQQAGAQDEEVADIQAEAMANIPVAQPQEQEQPYVLPEEDGSPAAVLQQLQARLEAGECSIPVPQQAQLGPLPLWQQCVLELVATHSESVPADVSASRLYACLTSGMLIAQSPAAAGDITALQQLLGDASFVTGPPVTPQPPRLPWGRLAAQAAVELRLPQLLAWALQPEQRQRLWGSAGNAAKAALVELRRLQCTPISNDVSRQPEQQRADMLQLQQQLLLGRPAFAELAAEIALLLLGVAPNEEGLLSDWLQHGLHPGSSEADLARAKAVLAAVVAAAELPAGAQVMRRDCFKQAQRIGDVDLLALVVLWGHRTPEDEDVDTA